MFTGKKFLFLKFGIDFTGKRINIFKELTKKNGGEIIEEENLSNNNIPDYIITSPKNRDFIFTLSNILNKENIQLIKKNSFSYEWFSFCIREKSIIEHYSYLIKFNDSISKKQDRLLKENFSSKKFISFSQDINNKFYSNLNLNTIPEEEKEKKQNKKEEKKSNEEIFTKIQNDIINNKIKSTETESEEETNFSQNTSDNENNNLSSNKKKKRISLSQDNINISIKKINNIKKRFEFFSNETKNNLNKNITDELEKVLEFHTNEGNTFNAIAYRRAITQIKKYKKKIEYVNDIPKIKGIGEKIKEKIKEILITGKCKKSEYVINDSKNKCIKKLSQVYGIGIKQANQFYQKGIKTIEDLKKISNELSNNIQKGLKYYDDILIKIPREEISEIYNIIKIELYKILPEKIIKIEVCGSYRRGKKLCGDIDILITRIDNGLIDGILETLINKLIDLKLIVETLSFSNSKNENECNVFMGICKWKSGINRRIDIKVYKKEYYPFAVLYFTGSAYFNRSMRLFARYLGLHLSDKELSYRKNGVKILCKNEREIFEKLGIEYKEPCDRDI